jgi:DNA polymerase
MILFYDFEVTMYDWLVTIIDPMNQKEYYFENDQPALVDFYDEHKGDIWVGCNNHHYDDYILKGLLCDFNPYDINEHIITKKQDGWKYSNLFKKIPLLSYDVMTRIDRGLKVWEGFLGNMIKESSTDFRIKRKLTKEELAEMRKYNRHDVEQTIEVFIEKKNDFDAIVSLIKMFPEVLSIKDIGLTKAQISAKILECERTSRSDEFDLFVLPCIQIKKYRQAIDFYMSMKGKTDPDEVYSQTLTTMIAGLEHEISWGGIHAGKKKYKNLGKSQGRQIWHVDVASFYPRLMIFHNLLTRNSKKPEKFKLIYDRRIELKRAGKKKEQAPLKIVINGTFGISKSKTSTAYDPRNANLICLNGQLMLIDLIEHLEVIDGFELIQSNTDGLIISLPDTDEAFDQMDDICHEWEVRCNMELEFDEIKALWGQKDVNNYVFEFTSGKLERKGAYLKELGALDYDLPIVNKAVVEYLVRGTPVEQTIGQCDDLKEFQMIKKIGQSYSHILHGGYWEKYKAPNPKTGKMKTFIRWSGDPKRLNEKCIRIFASKDVKDGGLWKVKGQDKKEKLEGTPDHCFIFNDDVNGVKCPAKLDRQWYINTAKDRLKGFGVL